MSTNDGDPRSRRRSVAKTTRKRGEKPIKVGLYLSLEASRRLGIKSLMDNIDKSQIVEDLIRLHLPRYVVQVRTDRGGDAEGGPDEIPT